MCGEGVERRGYIPQIAQFGTRHCDILAHWASKAAFGTWGPKAGMQILGGWDGVDTIYSHRPLGTHPSPPRLHAAVQPVEARCAADVPAESPVQRRPAEVLLSVGRMWWVLADAT